MIEKVFYNVFIFGTIISICISPLLIFLYKNKYKYKLKNIYKIFIIILLLLILPINSIDFSSIKGLLKKQEVFQREEMPSVYNETEIILETENTIIEVNDSINIKNNKLSNFSQFVPYLWISISGSLLLYNLFTYFMYMYNNKKNYVEKRVPEIEEKINKICKELNLKDISYAFSNSITTPMVVGIFKKRIILPVNIFETENYEMILMHEIIHIKNKDIECKFILLMINAIYWFNPVIYKFIDQVEEVLELRCDEIVLENQPQIYKIKYAQVLLNQIEANRNLKYRFSLNFANRRRNIMKRFSNIVDKNKKKNMIGMSCITASIIIITSAIIFSIPNINFASIQDGAFYNEDDNNLIVQENVIEEEKNEVTNSTVAQEEKTKGTSITYSNTPLETEENTENEIEEDLEEDLEEENVQNNTTSEIKKQKIVTAKTVSYFPSLIFPLGDINEVIAGFSGSYKHTGIDFKADEGTGIKACASGTVIYSAYKGSYGNLVIIDHGDDTQTYYAHCSELYVSQGQTVNQGDIIAAVGSTGNSTGPHLHLELRINRVAVNPIPYIKK